MGRKRNTGDNRFNIVYIFVCAMESQHQQIAELKSLLEESCSSCNFKKNKQIAKKNLGGFLDE